MTTSIQERLYPTLSCFGCGPVNGKGLQLRSFADGDSVIARFQPWAEHGNGLGSLNGGIISTLLDCHSAAAVMLEVENHGWIEPAGSMRAFVTARLEVQFLRPAPLDRAVDLRAIVVQAEDADITVAAQLLANGKACASATAVWRRWRVTSRDGAMRGHHPAV